MLLLEIQAFVFVVGIDVNGILQLRHALARQRGFVKHSRPGQEEAVARHNILVFARTWLSNGHAAGEMQEGENGTSDAARRERK